MTDPRLERCARELCAQEIRMLGPEAVGATPDDLVDPPHGEVAHRKPQRWTRYAKRAADLIAAIDKTSDSGANLSADEQLRSALIDQASADGNTAVANWLTLTDFNKALQSLARCAAILADPRFVQSMANVRGTMERLAFETITRQAPYDARPVALFDAAVEAAARGFDPTTMLVETPHGTDCPSCVGIRSSQDHVRGKARAALVDALKVLREPDAAMVAAFNQAELAMTTIRIEGTMWRHFEWAEGSAAKALQAMLDVLLKQAEAG